MKQSLTIFGILFLLSMNTLVVHAGNINEYEAAVVSVAKSQFESNGVRYQADAVYVTELINYLSMDDVDLTSAQRDEAIAAIYANVEQGISDGYLIPVKQQNNQEDIDKDSGNQEGSNKDSTTPDLEQTDSGQAGTGENKEGQASAGESEVDQAGQKTGQTTAEESTGQTAGQTTSQGNNQPTTEKITEDEAKDFIEEIIKPPATTTEIDKDNGKVTVTDKDNNNLLTVNTVIKNTGFNLNRTAITAVVIVIILAICVIVTIKYKFFAHMDE